MKDTHNYIVKKDMLKCLKAEGLWILNEARNYVKQWIYMGDGWIWAGDW